MEDDLIITSIKPGQTNNYQDGCHFFVKSIEIDENDVEGFFGGEPGHPFPDRFPDLEEIRIRPNYSGTRRPKKITIVSSSLVKLFCVDCRISELTLFCPRLEILDCSECRISVLKINTVVAIPERSIVYGYRLKTLNCPKNFLTALEIHSATLETLNCSWNRLVVLTLDCAVIAHVYCDFNLLQHFGVDSSTLRTLRCSRNALVKLALECPALITLECYYNPFLFQIEGMTSLKDLRFLCCSPEASESAGEQIDTEGINIEVWPRDEGRIGGRIGYGYFPC